MRLISKPDESDMQRRDSGCHICGRQVSGSQVGGNLIGGSSPKDFSVQPPCLAHLSLGTIAIHGVLEVSLRNRDEHLCGISWAINHTERKSRQ